jgi:hypothetical protein
VLHSVPDKITQRKHESRLRLFENKWFNRFTRREKTSDTPLLKAIQEAEDGLRSADLGRNLIKQRIPRPGQEKSGGYRSIILGKAGDKARFIYGFCKSGQANITSAELAEFKRAAEILLTFSNDQLS